MEVQEYTSKMKRIYASFLEFLDCPNEERDENLDNLLHILDNEKVLDNLNEMHEILILINIITKNHRRFPDFFDRIEKIFNYFEPKIKQTFTNTQIFNIFQKNKIILLLLFNHKILDVDQTIIKFFTSCPFRKCISYKYYFFNEIKEKVHPEIRSSIEQELLKMDPNVFQNFSEKCKDGENESILCSLIRNDSVEEFITYINKNNISPSTRINNSIFETNSMLVDKNPTLIEYAAFYGSIQIFQFLKFNNVEMKPTLWKYSIHGRNPEIIHLLEENNVQTTEDDNLIKYSLKCHHNEFANYFRDISNSDNYNYSQNVNNNNNDDNDNNTRNENFITKLYNDFKSKFFAPKIVDQIPKKISENITDDESFKYVFCYHNYELIPDDLNENNCKLFIKYMCEYNYIDFVRFLLKSQMVNIYNTYDDIFILILFYKTLFRIAAINNNIEIVNILLEHSDVNIENNAFINCYKLDKIVLPSFIQTLGSRSFMGCASLVDITMPSSLTKIYDYSFESCKSLKKLSIPSSVTYIGKYAFNDCQSLEEIELPLSLNSIEEGTFENCHSLKQIIIPSSVTYIGEKAFNSCILLESISITSPTISIGKNAFNNCSKLVEITFPVELETIEDSTFSECKSLIKVTIPSSVKAINDHSFYSCINLKEIELSHLNLKSIGKNAFGLCKSLTKIVLPSSLLTINDYAFCECLALTQVTFISPSSIASIGKFAFRKCSLLGEIAFPPSLKFIHKYAFSECSSLKQVVFESPSSLVSIGENAFFVCSSLKQIEIPPSTQSVGVGAFIKCPSLESLTVPSKIDTSKLGLFTTVRITVI